MNKKSRPIKKNDQGALRQCSDEDLAALAAEQLPYQTEAYEELMQRHQSKIYALSLKMLGNRHDAEDVSQEVMLKIFHHIQSFSHQSKFTTWLYRIVSNRCLDELRVRKRSTQRFVPLEEEHDVALPDATGQSDDAMTLQKAMAALNSDERMLIHLRYTAGLSFDEIADVMELGLSAVKMRHSRCMTKMYAFLQ